jgi:undecaprenyl-diphosphatase
MSIAKAYRKSASLTVPQGMPVTLLEQLLLAVIQGATEFLPVSSSAHLILGRTLMQWLGLAGDEMSAAEELAFDVALHVGSLGAVLMYFRSEIRMMWVGLLDLIAGVLSANALALMNVLAATLPILAVGFLLKGAVVGMARSVELIAATTILFGLLLWAADRRPEKTCELGEVKLRDALLIGAAQCAAIIPGVSRSGICMTAGRFLGLDRSLSARFAMLLSIPTILAAGLLTSFDLARAGNVRLTADAATGAVFAFFSAWAAIALLMRWLKTGSYLPFVLYRLGLGALLVIFLAGGALGTT